MASLLIDSLISMLLPLSWKSWKQIDSGSSVENAGRPKKHSEVE
jgi:hypothetical protein